MTDHESLTFCELMVDARNDAHGYAHETDDPLEQRLLATITTAIDAWLILHDEVHEEEGGEPEQPEPPVPLNREQRRAAQRHGTHVH